jgi:hypothetical protein
VASETGKGTQRSVIIDGVAESRKKEVQRRNRPQEYHSGINQEPIVGPMPTYNASKTEVVYKGTVNSFIILGKDKPRDSKTGSGSRPETHNAAIDIVAGMSGIMAREEMDFKRVATNKSPELDAARIYLSQKCSIDSEEYFNITEGVGAGSPQNVSAIAIKADAVRVIGRQGIKIVTGTDTYNVPGFNISLYKYGIDLITGNDESELEPMVRGTSLSDFCQHLLDLQSDLNAAFGKYLGGKAQSQILMVTNPAAAKLAEIAGQKTASVILAKHLKDLALAKLHYLTFFGDGYFLSRYNHTN